jgi:crotonobetainyl-CoA:carnitine CoA-transferase CaiB-like acyl-CoA transferase
MLAAILLDAPNLVRPAKSARAPIPQFRHYRCADGEWLYLAALAQPFFLSALEVLDLVDVMVLPGIDGEWLNLQVPPGSDLAIAKLESRFAQRPRDDWLKLLTEADVPCAPIETRGEWFASETIAANDLRVRVRHDELGDVELPGVPLTMSIAPTQVRLPDARSRLHPDACWPEPPRRVAAATTTMVPAPDAPLAGIRVLDLASFVAGTFGPSILAFLGAEVIKVESPAGDPYRAFSVAFSAYNQSKLGVGLDLKHADGRAAVLDLVRISDVVVDSTRPGVRARLGIDFASLCAVNHEVIRCSITGWGETGELAASPAFDPLIQARSGLMAAQGGADDPVYVSMLVHDVGTGTLAALGVLAALYQRARLGGGQEIFLSLASSSVLFQSGELTHFDERPDPTTGGRDWAGPRAAERLYSCADGWIAISARNAAHAEALFDELGVASAAPASELAEGTPARAIEQQLASLPVDEVLDRLTVHGVPAVRVLPRSEPYNDPWFEQNEFFHQIDQPELGPCTVVAGYASWAEGTVGYDAPAPRNGEHTAAVLRRLGIDQDRIDRLIASGAAHEHRDALPDRT